MKEIDLPPKLTETSEDLPPKLAKKRWRTKQNVGLEERPALRARDDRGPSAVAPSRRGAGRLKCEVGPAGARQQLRRRVRALRKFAQLLPPRSAV
jgi:hypothetical protein